MMIPPHAASPDAMPPDVIPPTEDPVLAHYRQWLCGLPGFEPRPVQERLVSLVGKALSDNRSLIVEAGTGAGKSFGYLIPLLSLRPTPIVVSTATLTLQEQLLHHDIPNLLKLAGLEDQVSVKLVKGRGHYLCIQKLDELERQMGRDAPERLATQALRMALAEGWDGDHASLEHPVPRSVWEEVRSDTEDCLGRRCRHFAHNPYRKAREGLDTVDILVTNHALYLQDLFNGQMLLPPHDVVVFDEAHTLKGYALNALTATVGKYATTRLLRKIHRRLEPVPDAMLEAVAHVDAELLAWLFRLRGPGGQRTSFRLAPDDDFLTLARQQLGLIDALTNWLNTLDTQQLSVLDRFGDGPGASNLVNAHRERLLSQTQGLAERWRFFLDEEPAAAGRRVNWVELDPQRLNFSLKSAPVGVAEPLRLRLWGEKTAILTSATLAAPTWGGQHALTPFQRDIGLEDADKFVLPSPFAYGSQCALYVPAHLPEPNHPDALHAMTLEIESLLNISRGRAFVLFTSASAMRTVAQTLIPTLPFPARIQGDLPRHQLIAWFKQTPGSVLFATSSFWEGVDVPGEALSLVIIDRLPFTPPDDPVHQAQVEACKAAGQDWFNTLQLPQALLRLKQGFGRLIRTRSDWGLVAILDTRLRSKGYGRRIIESLPPVPLLVTQDQCAQFFSEEIMVESSLG